MPEVGPDVPTTFGKYYLTEKLATGGMAEIYLAKLIGPNGFEKPLVIKQIHPSLSGQRQFVDLFVAEAKTLVTLAHGNIVPVYELGVVDDTYFIAMDYIDGPTLHRLTEIMAYRGGHMNPAIAAWIAARILDGLDYAHRKGGVVHRDLSPRNVMLSRDGEVKLVDFGIAVALSETETGVAVHAAPTGSFPYMSPEQVRREALSPQTDLFSVGVLLWEMLVGRRLFARSDADATLNAVLEAPIPAPSQERTGIPDRLDELVMRALHRDRSARWSTASDMLAPLNKLLYSLDTTPGPRDVAALVASYCPPSARRLPTDIEARGRDGDASVERSGPVHAGGAGLHTAVMPRDHASPKGKQQRHQTFATHVALTDMLQRAGTHDDRRPEFAPDDEREQGAARTVAFGRPPGARFLVAGSVIALALLIAAVYAFYQRRDVVLADHGNAATHGDAAIVFPIPADANVVANNAGSDANTRDAANPSPRDATPGGVNGPALPLARDFQGSRVDGGRESPLSIDAATGSASHRPKGREISVPANATRSATLTVGANPWGDVFVDGIKLPRHAPSDFSVTPGHHEIRVVFPAESPPLEKTCSIDIAAGETKRCDADFTK